MRPLSTRYSPQVLPRSSHFPSIITPVSVPLSLRSYLHSPHLMAMFPHHPMIACITLTTRIDVAVNSVLCVWYLSLKFRCSKMGPCRKPQKHDFSLQLTPVIEPKEGPGVELGTLEDAARFMGHMRPWRQARPHWEYAAELLLVAATTGQEADIDRATAQKERALLRDNRL
jgi:hypothetical protein